MNIDDRIPDRKYIFDCFSADKAKEYVGENCYMTDDFPLFEDLDFIQVYKLDAIDNNSFYNETEDRNFEYCLPVRFVKPVEKKYRPFTDTKEFFIKTNLEQGNVLYVRSKTYNPYEYHIMLVGWTDEGLMLGNFSEMTFDELLDKFELWDEEGGNFIPFGVEEE